MSGVTRREHALVEILKDDFSSPTENQQIVRVLFTRGCNLYQVEAADKSVFLVSMSTKFRKYIWVKRGDFVLVERVEEGGKVKAKMVRILTNEDIKQFKKDMLWPQEFNDCTTDTLKGYKLFINREIPIVSGESSPTVNQQIVRVLFTRGCNLYQVEAADKSVFLVSMSTKFRKYIWVKRGDFLLVERIEEGGKVKAKMVRILTNEDIRQFKKDMVWPQEFIDAEKDTSKGYKQFVNRKRPIVSGASFSDSDSSYYDSSDSGSSDD